MQLFPGVGNEHFRREGEAVGQGEHTDPASCFREPRITLPKCVAKRQLQRECWIDVNLQGVYARQRKTKGEPSLLKIPSSRDQRLITFLIYGHKQNPSSDWEVATAWDDGQGGLWCWEGITDAQPKSYMVEKIGTGWVSRVQMLERNYFIQKYRGTSFYSI